MGVSSKPNLMPLLLFFFFFFFPSISSSNEPLSVYEILEEFDLPAGLLPKGIVTGYELNRSTGEFVVNFNDSCEFSLENSYQLRYRPNIRGVVSKDRLASLKGVSVKVMWLWFNIREVARDGGDLDFSVGVASAEFPIDNFEESPQCGCGFDCGNGSSRSVSSSA